jgi:hypothetical protein
MNPALNGIWEGIQRLGLGALAHANHHAAFGHAPGVESGSWPELSITQAAHAAELLIKSRIAQEHPLLIFDQLPKGPEVPGNELELRDLMLRGRTVQWSDLPSRLWATTGLVIPNKDRFEHFGKLRNSLQHFGKMDAADSAGETLNFIFEVIDPFVNQCWGLFAMDYDEDYEPYLYFVNALVQREILFLVSPGSATHFKDWAVDWSSVSPLYRDEMHARVEQMRSKNSQEN